MKQIKINFEVYNTNYFEEFISTFIADFIYKYKFYLKNTVFFILNFDHRSIIYLFP